MTLREAARQLAAGDPDLARIHGRHGFPPLWARRRGFATLALIILEQQVSLASGRAAFERLRRAAGEVTPRTLGRLGRDGIQAAGITRQKARYLLELARELEDGTLNLRSVARAPDGAAREALMRIPGIGHWTADIYLLMALRRQDVWPLRDLALRSAFGRLRGLPEWPSDEALAAHAERWRPYRSVAARMLWHYYLSEPRSGTAGAATLGSPATQHGRPGTRRLVDQVQ